MTSGRRDILAQILRQVEATDSYGQPSGEWVAVRDVWVAHDVSGSNTRKTDQDKPSYAATFVGLAVDLAGVEIGDRLRDPDYGDFQLDAFEPLLWSSRQMLALKCSAILTTQTIPGVLPDPTPPSENPMLLDADGNPMKIEDDTNMILE